MLFMDEFVSLYHQPPVTTNQNIGTLSVSTNGDNRLGLVQFKYVQCTYFGFGSNFLAPGRFGGGVTGFSAFSY